MARRKVSADKFAVSINSILGDYALDITKNTRNAVELMAKEGTRQVKANSRAMFKRRTGRYAKGWDYTMESNRYLADAVVYQSDVYQLPHLLEHGHANVNGGRTPGRAHIGPVEQQIIQEFERRLKAGI